ncbi:helix-turn-helix domain-containing protein [Pseudonocardia sp. H11422]|uniref:helix-turn-helix domain-containing protein n=1 Tax=Pseudonocardia sp. H11422 TaxID=2835866 RepID=UPI001BDD132A|nr:helix-turn-helix domain-containing protein [Pseudonocardia sp. H11422]
MAPADVLLHPVRLRIAQAFLGDRALTTSDLREELPDVPAATLYRHVASLVDAAVLQVVSERRVRGTVERTYRLPAGAGSVGPEEAATMSVEGHRQGFLAFVAGLLADFDRYLERDDVDLGRDLLGYRQAAMYLTDDELRELIAELRAVLAPRIANPPSPDRVRRILTTVLMPGE